MSSLPNICGIVTSNAMIQYLKELKIFVWNKLELRMLNWLIVLDNASIHRSTELIKCMKEENMSFAYIPPYSPELVQIERYFGMLNRILIKNNNGNQINWKSKATKDVLESSMSQISPQNIRNFRKTFTFEIKKNLDRLIDLI